MNINIINIVEALLFSSDKPLSVKQIKDIINEEKETSDVKADIKSIESAITQIQERYNAPEFSFALLSIAGGFVFGTKKPYAVWLAKMNKEKLKRRLSQSALETLSIIAYNQPITKSEMEAIRGVNVDYIVGSLLEKNLITIRGRAEVPGRPMLYSTTEAFLEYLGINSINDLPPLKEISEIIKTGPPEGVSQSDIDFYEEINQVRNKTLENPEISESEIDNENEIENEAEAVIESSSEDNND